MLYTATGDVAIGVADAAAADDPALTDATTRIAMTTPTARTTATATLPPIRIARNDVLPINKIQTMKIDIIFSLCSRQT